MLSSMLQVFIIRIIHIIISLVQYVIVLCRHIFHRDFFLNELRRITTFSKDNRLTTFSKDIIGNHVKIPVHVGVILADDDYSFKDLANVIIWSVFLGISIVTIHDIDGNVKRNYEQLVNAMREKMDCGGDDANMIHIISQNDNCFVQCAIIVKYGRGRTRVSLLSADDGAPSLAIVAQKLCRKVSCQEVPLSSIAPPVVSDLLHDTYPFPDPDLVLKCGGAECLLGYLPWHLRLAEIISVPSPKSLSRDAFFSVLYTFSLTMQRCGK